jgi:hypothetical protein
MAATGCRTWYALALPPLRACVLIRGVARPRHLPDLVARAVLTRLTEGVRGDLADMRIEPLAGLFRIGQDLVHRRGHNGMVPLSAPRCTRDRTPPGLRSVPTEPHDDALCIDQVALRARGYLIGP